MTQHRAEVLIVGAGIVGLTIARELVAAGCDDVIVIDKENRLGCHASGRNSGVLHAGVYYLPGSAKARWCLEGNYLMRDYCREKGLPLLESGKVIVTRTEDEIPALHELHRRATANGARVDLIDPRELEDLEPHARTCSQALFSHDTAVVDPQRVVHAIADDLERSRKVRFLKSCRFVGLGPRATALTTCGRIGFRHLVNAAGAYCDRVAHAFGVGRGYRMAPFKGIYRKLKAGRPPAVRGSIYPVPDIRNPFLGVHFTRSIHGTVYLGPTAIPAFGRENYGILQGIDAEGFAIMALDAALFVHNPGFRAVALSEPRKYFPRSFYNDAVRLVKKLDPADIEPSPKVGIRAQLVDWARKELVTDFLVVKGERSLHVLNPISPAFTSSMALARRAVRMLDDV